MDNYYDYIVVGAGSAGCVVAARLSETPDAHVLLIEAGGDERTKCVSTPPDWPMLAGSEMDWSYRSVRQAGTGHVHAIPRGKVLGGSGSINAMAFLRGHRQDFDSWAQVGNAGWGWESVLPYFKRMEDVPAGDPRYRGRGGPLQPAPNPAPHPLTLSYLDAAAEIGYPLVDDLNTGELDGASRHDMLIHEGRRQSTASAYLRPAMSRPNLHVRTRAQVQRLVFDGTRSAGVEYVSDGRLVRAAATSEVVLCAGAIGSPQLLLMSGIGPAEELRRLGIDVVADRPQVGRNLHDHILLGAVSLESERPIPAPSGNLGEATIFTSSTNGQVTPDLQLVLIQVPFHNPWQSAPPNSCTFAVGLMRPASRGSLRLSSPDPSAAPLIDYGYLRERSDLETLVEGIERATQLRSARAFDPWRVTASTAATANTLDELRQLVRESTSTYSHPVGSCRMGIDNDAVVDPTLRVNDIDGLRIADASVMPTIVSANTNAASIMIAEKAADLMRPRCPDQPPSVDASDTEPSLACLGR